MDRPLSQAIAEAMDQAGIWESTTHRKVGTYELGELLAEGEGWQDFAAQHPDVKEARRRVRIYLAGQAFTDRGKGDRGVRRDPNRSGLTKSTTSHDPGRSLPKLVGCFRMLIDAARDLMRDL